MDHNLLVVPEDLCKPIKANCVEQNEAEQEDEEGEEQEDDQNCKNTVTVKAQTKRFLRLVGPQLAVVLLLAAYLLLGALCFRLLDPQLSAVPFAELVLFCFETLATIGYGNICPSAPLARLFAMVYALFGIPLCMLTIANLGKHLTKAYWVLFRACRDKRLSRPLVRPRLPVPVLLALFLLCLFCVSLLCPLQPHQFLLPTSFYFGVISFSTVGFGDHFPFTDGAVPRLLAHLCLLSGGMILLGAWFALVRDLYVRFFRFHRRRFRHVRDVPVWFGRRRMRLSTVLEVVARELQASPVQIQQVLEDLDFLLISDAAEAAEIRKHSSAILMASGAEEEKGPRNM